jgi:mRNA interferase MazF
VISADRLNQGPAGLAVVLPVTTRARGIPSHVPISQLDSGLDHDSFILTEQIRSVSTERLLRSIGRAPPSALEQVERWLRVLLEL